METVPLKATTRTDHGKGPARRLRAGGEIPSVAYGRGHATESLSIDAKVFRDILLSERGRNSIIELTVDGGSSYAVMVKDYSVHPVTRALLHVDFIRIDMSKPIECEVPFVTVGKSKGEGEGGTLLTNVRTLTVRCMPSNIPDRISHDVSELAIDDVVKVGELTLPEGAEVLLPLEYKLIVVKPPRVIEAEEKPEEEGAAEGEAPAEGEGAAPAEGGEKAAPGAPPGKADS